MYSVCTEGKLQYRYSIRQDGGYGSAGRRDLVRRIRSYAVRSSLDRRSVFFAPRGATSEQIETSSKVPDATEQVQPTRNTDDGPQDRKCEKHFLTGKD